MKVVVIGNSGSGKTWLADQLANQLAACASATVIHLDELFWEPGGFDQKRSKDEVLSLIEISKLNQSWVVEGVFGELAEHYFPEAETLVWLDLDWSTCKARLERRETNMAIAQSQAGLAKLLAWASAYYSRTDKRSFEGHRELFEQFTGIRIRLRSEEACNAFIADTQQGAKAYQADPR